MQRPAKPWTPVRFRAQPPYISQDEESSPNLGSVSPTSAHFSFADNLLDASTMSAAVIGPKSMVQYVPSLGGEIGRRKGLKIPRWKHRAGSIPARGTISIIVFLSPQSNLYLSL